MLLVSHLHVFPLRCQPNTLQPQLQQTSENHGKSNASMRILLHPLRFITLLKTLLAFCKRKACHSDVSCHIQLFLFIFSQLQSFLVSKALTPSRAQPSGISVSPIYLQLQVKQNISSSNNNGWGRHAGITATVARDMCMLYTFTAHSASRRATRSQRSTFFNYSWSFIPSIYSIPDLQLALI